MGVYSILGFGETAKGPSWAGRQKNPCDLVPLVDEVPAPATAQAPLSQVAGGYNMVYAVLATAALLYCAARAPSPMRNGD